MIDAAAVIREVEERYDRINPLPKGWEMEPSAAILIAVLVEAINRELDKLGKTDARP